VSSERAVRGWWIGLCVAATGYAAGCGNDRVEIPEIDCDDDGIGWVLELDGLHGLPNPEFGVECGQGWGHGVETRAADAIIELPNDFQHVQAHPDGGLVVLSSSRAQLWSERLGVEVAEDALLWVDESAEQLHWLRDDQSYRPPAVVWTEDGAQLWVVGWEPEGPSWMTAIDPGSGETIAQVEAIDPPASWDPAWPEVGGVWFTMRESFADDHEVHGLYRMAELGQVEGPLRTRTTPKTECCGHSVRQYPTPGGGVLWDAVGRIERLDESGALIWAVEQPHVFALVDDQGSFLLGNVPDGEIDDQRGGLTLERRSLADGSVIWSRVHHRYDFSDTPRPDDWLIDFNFGFAARADGGYLVGAGHAYPASSCPRQPSVWAISAEGEVEWAHRVETCGAMSIVRGPLPGGLVGERALVRGFAYLDDDGSNGNIDVRWLQAFELANP
jgi:hypothetical protein